MSETSAKCSVPLIGWMFHKWGRWEKAKIEIRDSVLPWSDTLKYTTLGQIRYCLICNKEEIK